MKVTRTQIDEAMKATGGRMLRAALILNIARNNLYKRMASLKMSPNSYRGNTVTQGKVSGVAHATDSTGLVAASGATSATNRDPLSRSAIYRSRSRVRKFPSMSTAAPSVAPPEEAKPLRISRSVYLRPDQIKALDDACLDLAPILREKLSPSKVLERFIDRHFAGFLVEEGAVPAPAAEKPRKAKGEKP
jgi:hypothetical protein